MDVQEKTERRSQRLGDGAAVRALLKRWGEADQLRREAAQRLGASQWCLSQIGGGGAPESAGPKPQSRAVMAMYSRVIEARDQLADEAARCGDELTGATSLCEAVDRALGRLSVRARQIVTLRYRQGMTWVAIGARLGIDESYARRFERMAVERMRVDPALKPYLAA